MTMLGPNMLETDKWVTGVLFECYDDTLLNKTEFYSTFF